MADRASSTQGEVYLDIINDYMGKNSDGNLKLVVVGESGQGKSTLINGLLGKEVAKEGEGFEAGTVETKYYSLNQNGICVQIWDTPGFGFGTQEEDDKMVEQLRSSECYPHDLALFCFRMDGARFPTRLHTDTVKKLTEVFGTKFWKHTVFILTFANAISHFCPPNEELEEFFSSRVWTLEKKVQEMLQKEVRLSEDEARKVRVIPVGSYRNPGYDKTNPWKLPDREDWFLWFWMECTEHMRHTAFRALLQANRHRIKIPVVSEEAPVFGQDPPPPPKQAFERSIVTLDYSGSENEESYSEDMALEQHTPMIEECTGQSENFTASPFSREIPIYDMLQCQLDDQNSSFYMYVKEYAKKRGASVWVGGHVGGLIEGFFMWLGKNSRMKRRKKDTVD